jgi:hypothetical protein
MENGMDIFLCLTSHVRLLGWINGIVKQQVLGNVAHQRFMMCVTPNGTPLRHENVT